MGMAATLERYLIRERVDYDVLAHAHTGCSLETAQAAHIPGGRLAKGVVLEDEAGAYLMAVVPASRHLRLGAVRALLQRKVGLATERELTALFTDCAPGAVPPLGPAYGLETVVDDSLSDAPELYFEAGDHEELVHLATERFFSLLGPARRGAIADRA